jgi:hypothetical protein
VCRVISEAFIASKDPKSIILMLSTQLASLCSMTTSPDGWIMKFDTGRAIMNTTVNMLMMRVEADDLIGSYSIKTVIEGHLLESDGFTQKTLLWVAARAEPFASLEDYTTVIIGRARPL